MMRARLVHPAFFSDAKVARLTLAERLYFVATWLHTDDYGNVAADPEDMFLFAFPGGLPPSENGRTGASLMEALVRASLVVPYDGDGRLYHHIPGILRHQEMKYVGKPRCPLMPGQAMPRGGQPQTPKAPKTPKADDPPKPRRAREKKAAASPMIPPTVEEATEHAKALGLPAKEAERFVAYHTSKGWKVGKEPMRDWKAAMVTWKHNWDERAKQGGKEGDKPFWM